MSTWQTVATIVGLAAVTLLTRGFFLLPKRPVPMPHWLQDGLRYAPLAAIVAVVAPEVVMAHGHLIDTWRDPRPYAAGVAALYFWWRRGILGTIVTGTAVFAALRLGWGW